MAGAAPSGEMEELETEFSRIMDAAIDPLLEMCRRMADLRGEKGGGWERAIFLANCVGYLEVSMRWPLRNGIAL